MCVLILSTILSEIFLILTRIKLQIIINAHRCPRKVPVILGQILMKLEFSGQIFEKRTKTSNLMKIRPVDAELFHADGRTDRHDEANICFSQFFKGTYI